MHRYPVNSKNTLALLWANMDTSLLLLLLFLLLLLLLTNSPEGLSKLWGGGVPTLDIYHSGPRLCRLLLCSLLIGPAPPSAPAVQCTASPAVAFCPGSAGYHPPTRASPVSVPAPQKNFARLSLTRHFQRPTPLLLTHPHHACRIPVAAAPTLPPKYLLTWLSDVVPHPPVTNMALKTSPLPRISYPPHIPWR